MTFFSITSLRLFGVIGVIGAILFIFGDLLYNHIPGSTKSHTLKMSELPNSRLLNAGTLGLIGCWFYTFASLHVYIAFRPVGDSFAFILLLSAVASMVCYGISHTAYFSIAAGARVARSLGGDVETGGSFGNTFFKRLVMITYVPVAILSVMMTYGILVGKSLYPRWMVIFLPIVIYLLRKPVTSLLKGRIKELINDSYDNFVLLVYFIVSSILLWNAVVT